MTKVGVTLGTNKVEDYGQGLGKKGPNKCARKAKGGGRPNDGQRGSDIAGQNGSQRRERRAVASTMKLRGGGGRFLCRNG